MHKYNRLLKCPYCETRLDEIYRNTSFGILKCLCSEFPVIEDIIYIQKDDLLLNKQICQCIKNNLYDKAVLLALSTQFKLHKYVVYSIYKLAKYFGSFSIDVALFCLYAFGPSRSWFSYLQKRLNKSDINFAVCKIGERNDLNKTIVDVGCGIGQFYTLFSKKHLRDSITYIGIEKSFLSLLLARMTHSSLNALFICSNVESGIPLEKNIATSVLFLDCFTWIYNKQRLINLSYSSLKHGGQLYIINTRRDKLICEPWWGYGLNAPVLKQYLHRYRQIEFYSEDYHREAYHHIFKKYSYSCIAKKT